MHAKVFLKFVETVSSNVCIAAMHNLFNAHCTCNKNCFVRCSNACNMHKHYLEKKLVICNYLFILTLGNLYAMEVWYGCKKEGSNKAKSCSET